MYGHRLRSLLFRTRIEERKDLLQLLHLIPLSSAGVGKSSLAATLSMALASMGKKVHVRLNK